MVRLGTPVRWSGHEGRVIARTMSGEPFYDLRLADGRIVHYVREADLAPAIERALPPERAAPAPPPSLN